MFSAVKSLSKNIIYVDLGRELDLNDVKGIAREIAYSSSSRFNRGDITCCFDVRRLKGMRISNFKQLREAGVENAIRDLKALVQIGGKDISLVRLVASQLGRQMHIRYEMVETLEECYKLLNSQLAYSSEEIGANDKDEFAKKVASLKSFA
jgi:hypothetical protein